MRTRRRLPPNRGPGASVVARVAVRYQLPPAWSPPGVVDEDEEDMEVDAVGPLRDAPFSDVHPTRVKQCGECRSRHDLVATNPPLPRPPHLAHDSSGTEGRSSRAFRAPRRDADVRKAVGAPKILAVSRCQRPVKRRRTTSTSSCAPGWMAGECTPRVSPSDGSGGPALHGPDRPGDHVPSPSSTCLENAPEGDEAQSSEQHGGVDCWRSDASVVYRPSGARRGRTGRERA